MNALLDHCSIERIVLFDDPAKAERVMKTGRQNVMRAVMEDGMIVEIKNGVTSNFANRQANQPLRYINANVKQLFHVTRGTILRQCILEKVVVVLIRVWDQVIMVKGRILPRSLRTPTDIATLRMDGTTCSWHMFYVATLRTMERQPVTV